MSGPGSANGFQTFVNNALPPGIAGDFAGANIRTSVVAGPGAYVASAGGVSVGLGAWFNPATGIASNYYQPNSFFGFVHRNQQALIPKINGIAGVQVPGGDMITGMGEGDFWGLFASGGTAGQTVYTDPVTGALTANSSGNSVTATGTAGTVSSGVLTVTAGTGTIAIGQIVTGGTLPAGTYIASGTGPWTLANVDGTAIPNNASSSAYNFYGVQATQYQLAQTVTADASITAAIAVPVAGVAESVMTVSATGSGTLAVGQWLSGTGLAGSLNCQILSFGTYTATAGTGTVYVTPVQTAVSSTTITATQGKLGKISSWLTV